MNFLDSLEKITSMKQTENGAMAYNSTLGGAVLDLFSVVGALRSRPEEVVRKFKLAWAENRDLATLIAFYGRDVRGGLGERTVGRLMLRTLGELFPKIVAVNLDAVVGFGRWDDLLVFLDNARLKATVLDYIKAQLIEDIDGCSVGKPISLLGKWLPSENASSSDTIRYARMIRKHLGITSKMYRKTLTKLRACLKVVEATMSDGRWKEIEYQSVPSNAMNRYMSAFGRHDYERFDKYLNDVKEGKQKINSSVLYPYDIVGKFGMSETHCYNRLSYQEVAALDAQWKALPNYIEGEHNYLVMADFSGSMTGRPMDTSLGLAIYFAERNKGLFANKFMSFTNVPHLHTVSGDTIEDKIESAVTRSTVGYDTNLEKAFEVILQSAIASHCEQSELPEALIIISDMEINSFGHRRDNFSFYSEMKSRFAAKGYEIPKAVFWNVASRQDTFLASADEKGVSFVSGHSASTFKTLMGTLGSSAVELMLKTLGDERYSHIILPSKVLDF